VLERRAPRGIDEFLDVGRHLVAFREKHGAAGLHLLHGLGELGTPGLQVRNVLGRLAIFGLALFEPGGADGLIDQVRDPGEALVGFREGGFVLVEGVAQDAAPDGLQFGADLADPDGVPRLQAQHVDLLANGRELRYAESGKARAEQQKDGEAAVKPAANPKIEK
jgi:hypothetical protein